MAVSETQVAGLELERVLNKVPVLFERDDTFYASVPKSKSAQKISNRQMRIPLNLRPGGRFGHYSPSGGDLGRGDGPTWDKAVISVEHLKHALEFEALAEMATDNRRKAVQNAVQQMLATGMAEFRRNVDALCQQGGDGVLATINTVATSGGNDTYTCDTSGDGFGVRLLRYGQSVSVYDSALTTRRVGAVSGGEVVISTFDGPNKQVVVPEVTSAAATDKIVVSGLTATPPVSLLGVPYHHTSASTGTWLGFTRSSTPEVRANRVNAAGALALPFPRLAKNKIGDRVGAGKQKSCVAWMHPAQKQAYEELGQLVSVIQKQSKEQALDLYFGDNMQMAGAPVKEHFNWDKTRIDFIVKEAWGRAEMDEPGFYTVDGRKIFEVRGASGGVATSNVFYLTASFNLFVNNPAACSYIDGLTIPTGY
tara:strand:+ start:6353 stop:7621 length:1269 start_codon:yes stop_codon:yes gene_type:complete